MTPKRPSRASILAAARASQFRPDQEREKPTTDRERFIARRVEQNRKDSAPIVRDLKKLGFDVEWVSDLFNRAYWYESAIPILLDWLPRMSNEAVKEAIVRALTVKWARPMAAQPLIEEFRRTIPDKGLKWAIGNALETVGDDSVFDDIVVLARDERHGRSRSMLPMALGNMKGHREQAIAVLIDLLDDPITAGHAIIGLRRLGAVSSRPSVTPFLANPEPWIRNEAKKAIAKFDRLDAGKRR